MLFLKGPIRKEGDTYGRAPKDGLQGFNNKPGDGDGGSRIDGILKALT